jgi:RNA polymerase sigma factor (sigma-70 family)
MSWLAAVSLESLPCAGKFLDRFSPAGEYMGKSPATARALAMSDSQLGTVIRHVRRIASTQESVEASDRDLLQAFAVRRDEAAFAVLVRRHGPMVHGVCRHVLGNVHEAEDAFQAAFVVLARKASALRRPEALASWLHGVAFRIARNARRAAGRRQAREAQAGSRTPANPAWEAAWREVQAVLDDEVERLPEKYREVFVLCCLEGQGRAEAAGVLRLKEGTVASRLAQARLRLQRRLAARGIALSAVLGATAVWSPASTAAVPAALVAATTALVQQAAGHLADSAIAVPVAALVRGMLRGMLLTRLKHISAVLLVLGVLGAGVAAGRIIHGTQPAEARAASQVSPPQTNGAQTVPPGLVTQGPQPSAGDGPVRRKGKPAAQDKPLSAWIEALKSPDRDTRIQAAEAIGRFGPAGKPAVPALCQALADKEIEVQLAVAAALWQVDRAAFTEVLTDKKDSAKGRWAATLALLRIGTGTKELVPVVLKMAADAQDDDRPHALWALPAIGADAADAVPVLRKALQDQSSQYARMLAAQALSQYGPQAKEVLPALYQALTDADSQVRVDAAGAVWQVEQKSDKAMPVLMKALQEVNQGAARQRAIHYLGKMGPQAREAFPALLALWKDNAAGDRQAIAKALKAIDAKAAAAAGVK